MKKAVQGSVKLDTLKKELADVDKVACALKKSHDDLKERLAECEDKFVKCCNENHELRDQLLQQPRSHSCNCRDKAATEKKKLQAKLDQMARELIEKNDNGLDSHYYFVSNLKFLFFREKVNERTEKTE
jgi:septation ring formation regulator EzrA